MQDLLLIVPVPPLALNAILYLGALTVILQVAILPLSVLAVIVALPAAMPFTTPLLVTVATAVLEEVHVTLSVEPLGVTVAFNVRVSFL